METETERNYILRLADLRLADREIEIKATSKECAAIAARFEILCIEAFSANCTATPWRKKGISLTGRIRARLEQSCIVTLEPVAQQIDVPFRALFWPAKYADELPDAGLSGEIFNDITLDDSPELYENDEINMGETVLEYFALAIDPYPKKPDTIIRPDRGNPEQVAIKPSPFLVLKDLKNGGE